MKTLLFIISLSISGCCLFRSSEVQYVKSDSTVTVTDRYVHIPEILVDGATAELTVENDSLLTFSDVFTDSTTGKKIEISGVIPKKKDKIHFTARVPKDSVKVQDSSKVVTLKPIPPNLAWWEKIPRYVIAIIAGLIILLIVYGIVRKK